MGSNVDKYLEPNEHALVDHTGIPGVTGGGGITGEIVPVGIIVPFGGSVASIPTGYLACDGSTINQATFADLFLVIGTTWNTGGEPGGEFRLPDLRHRVISGLNDGTLPAGADGGFTTRTIATLVGGEDHTHTVDPHTHTISATASAPTGVNDANIGGLQGGGAVTAAAAGHIHADNGAAHDHTGVTGSDSPGTDTVDNLDPTAFMPYIIKAVEGAPGVVGIGSDTLPTGSIISYGGAVASVPVGFLPCDGTLVDQTVEPALFAVIGTTWNIGGEPGGFFRLPDLRAKTISGVNDGTLPAGIDGGFITRSVADLAGAETHGHSGSASGAHSHTTPVHSHTITSQADHNHGATGEAITGPAEAGAGLISSPSQFRHTHSTASAGVHDHTGVTGVDSTTTDAVVDHSHSITTGDSLGPTAFCPYIIKAKQVGGGLGTTAQNNGGALIGPQPTFNFIPSGQAGISIVEDVGNNRLDITISSSLPAQVSGPERTAGTEAALRSFSPLDVATMVVTHTPAVVVDLIQASTGTSKQVTVPANTLTQSDDCIHWVASGSMDDAGTNSLRIRFNGVDIMPVLSGKNFELTGAWYGNGYIIRTGATTAVAFGTVGVFGQENSTGGEQEEFVSPFVSFSLTWSASNNLDVDYATSPGSSKVNALIAMVVKS